MGLAKAVNDIFELVKLLLIVRIALSWFPNLDWWKQPFKFLYEVTEPILRIFRNLIPPISGIDFSPIVAFLALQILQGVIVGLLSAF